MRTPHNGDIFGENSVDTLERRREVLAHVGVRHQLTRIDAATSQ